MSKWDDAEDEFCFENDDYIAAIMEESGCSYEEAVWKAKAEMDDYWREVLKSHGIK